MKALRFLRALPLALLLTAPARADQGSIVGPTSGPKNMAEVMAAVNAALLAIQSCNSGTSAPANGAAAAPTRYQCWADTSAAGSNVVTFKTYDGASWVTFGQLNTSTHLWTPYRNGAPIAAVATSSSAADLTTGTLPAARLPVPTGSTLGGVQALACSASNWLRTISTAGVPACSQPAFSDLVGSVAAAQMPALTGDVTTPAGGVATTIGANKVLDGMLRQSVGLSIVGRASNVGGNVADITAVGGSSCAFRESGNAIGCGQLATAALVNNAVSNGKLAQMGNGTTKCRTTAGSGDPEDCTAAQMRALLTLVVGTDVQAYHANLSALASVTGAAGKVPYFTGLNALALFDSTSFGRSAANAADAAALRALAGLVIGSDIQAFDSDLLALAANATNGFWSRTGAGTGAARVMTGTANEVCVTNGDGAAGAPTFGICTGWLSTAHTWSGQQTFASPVFTGAADVQGVLRLSSFVTATQLTANANNFTATDGTDNCSGKRTLRVSTNALRNITGLSCSQANGDILIVHNVGSFAVVLTSEDAASVAANRFLLSGDMTLPANTSVMLRYDGVSSRWRAVTTPGGGGGGGGGVTTVATDDTMVGGPISSSGILGVNPLAVRGYKAGLILSTAGASTTFGITVGTASDSTDVTIMQLNSALSKTTAAWAIGNGGALDTGTVTASTWYHVHLMQRSDTGVVDSCISLSVSACTTGGSIPAAYNRFRRIGSVLINASTQIAKFTQSGNRISYGSPTLDMSAVNTTTAATAYALTVPPGVSVQASVRILAGNTAGQGLWIFYSPNEGLQTPNSPAGNNTHYTLGANQYMTASLSIATNTSRQIMGVSNTSSNNQVWAVTTGYIENFGEPLGSGGGGPGLPTIANGQILANAGGGATQPVGTSGTSWFDAAWCNTVGYAVTRLTGSWACSRGSPVNVTWFGADPTGAVDSYAAFVAAQSSGACGGNCQLWVPKGSYKLSNTFTLNNGTQLACENKSATVLTGTAVNSNIINILSGGNQMVSNCQLTYSASQSGSAAIAISGTAHNVTVRDVIIPGGQYYGIYVSGTTYIVTLDNIETNGGVTGVVLLGQNANVKIARVEINGCSGAAFDIQASGGVVISDSATLQCQYGMQISPGSGQTVKAVEVTNTYLDTSNQENLRIAPAAGGTVVSSVFTGLWLSSSATSGGALVGISGGGVVQGLTFNSPIIVGNAGHGMVLQNSSSINIVGAQITGNSMGSPGVFDGIYSDTNASLISITGSRIGPSASFGAGGHNCGIRFAGATSAPSLIAIGNTLGGNTAGLCAGTLGPQVYTSPNTL